MNVKKEATKDALEFARAQMAYGQGAGTRRKLIKATVDHKADTVPGYLAEFYAASRKVDLSALASEAKRNRRAKDAAAAASKSAKGLATGNYRSVSTPILVVAGVGYVLHQTGLDKKIWVKTKDAYHKAKNYRNAKIQVRLILNETKEN